MSRFILLCILVLLAACLSYGTDYEEKFVKKALQTTTPPKTTPPPKPSITVTIEDITPKQKMVNGSFFEGKKVILFNRRGEAWEGTVLEVRETYIKFIPNAKYRNFGTDKVKKVKVPKEVKIIGKSFAEYVITENLTLYAYDRKSGMYYYLE